MPIGEAASEAAADSEAAEVMLRKRKGHKNSAFVV